MKNFVRPVNEIALLRAAEAVVGKEVTDTIVRVYRAIDGAMFEGHQMGLEDAEVGIDERLDAAFDNGFDEGEQFGRNEHALEAAVETLEEAEDGYDAGYLDGVRDARLHPADADNRVQEIINEQAGDYFDQLEGQLD